MVNAVAGHLATRRAAGLFDFSFMGHFEIAGPGARAFLERVQTRSLEGLAPGRILYTLLLREDGSVFNDATLWRLGPDHYWLFTGRPADFEWLSRTPADAVELRQRSGDLAILALQGPRCFEMIDTAPPYFRFTQALAEGEPATIGRLGYSGELGVEILVLCAAGPSLWQRLKERGAQECSFETANSLRIESGYILFSHELAARPDPFELGLARLVTGHGFVGAEALAKKRFRQPRRKLVGLLADGSTRRAGSLPEAELTSEAWSPIFERQLGMGFAPTSDAAPGTLVRFADGRLARCARLPFYDPGRALPRGAILNATR
jgi:aminomethyltransferase